MPTTLVDYLGLLVKTQLALFFLIVGVQIGTPLIPFLPFLLFLEFDHIVYLLWFETLLVSALHIIIEETAGTVEVPDFFFAVEAKVDRGLRARVQQTLVVETHLASLAVYHTILLLTLVALPLGPLLFSQVVKTD